MAFRFARYLRTCHECHWQLRLGMSAWTGLLEVQAHSLSRRLFLKLFEVGRVALRRTLQLLTNHIFDSLKRA